MIQAAMLMNPNCGGHHDGIVGMHNIAAERVTNFGSVASWIPRRARAVYLDGPSQDGPSMAVRSVAAASAMTSGEPVGMLRSG